MTKGGDGSRICRPETLAALVMGITFTGVYVVAPLLPLVCVGCLLRNWSPAIAALLALFFLDASMPLPQGSEGEIVELPPALLRCFVTSWRTYHRYRIVREGPPLDSSRTYLFGASPHGVFPMGQWLTNPTGGGATHEINDALPVRVRGTVATVLLRIPLLRHLLSWRGLVASDREIIRRLLKRGVSVVVIPGGIREMYVSGMQEERVVLRSRRGFISLAQETGATLVPIYVFGNTLAFKIAPPPQRLERISRRLRVGLMAFSGRWGLPVPFRVPITVVVGQPVEHVAGESVDDLQERYIAALASIFERHKTGAGYPADKKLIVI
jgi:diacylglycerol O-acyltransferase 2, plant